jgi:hypothetical protein
MAHRICSDAAGLTWEVWEVHPRLARLHSQANPPQLAPELRTGWLAFRSQTGERRRINPIPHDWDSLQDDQLCDLIAAARPLHE